MAAYYYIREMVAKTGVKASTIRFYESAGFLEPVGRLRNHYRIFNEHHILQVRVCSLVFGGFINARLRKISMKVIEGAKAWNPETYDLAADRYRQAIECDIILTKKAIGLVTKQYIPSQNDEKNYSKKEAAELLGTTPEAIRGWERNGLLQRQPAYAHRVYGHTEIDRMYMIRLLLNIGYSCMAILRFLTEFDSGDYSRAAKILLGNAEDEELVSRADKYLKALETGKGQADELCGFLEDIRKT